MPLQHQRIQGSGEVVRISRDVTASAQCTTLRGSWKKTPSYGYVEAPEPGFMLPGWVDRGADALVSSGRIGADMAAALQAEA
jgi:hypothetical protein